MTVKWKFWFRFTLTLFYYHAKFEILAINIAKLWILTNGTVIGGYIKVLLLVTSNMAILIIY